MDKILILANHDVGLYNFRLELIQLLIQEGYEVHFSVPMGSKVSLIVETGAIHHPTVMNRRGKNPVQDLGLLWHYIGLIKRIRPAAVLTYTAKPNIYGGMACAMLRVKQLANITGLGSELHGNGKAAVLLRRLYRTGLRQAKTVFFQNERDLAYFTEHGLLAGQEAVVLPGSGVNLDRFALFPGKAFSPAGRARFLFISRIMQDKGIEEFLGAACSIKRAYPDSRFTILGFFEGEAFRSRIQELLGDGVLEAVLFSEDTRVQMTQADCVVHPSWHEGMSNVLLEAAASGLPVICSDIPGCHEAVVDGASGLLHPVKSEEALAACMMRYIAYPAAEKQAMGLAGRRHMEALFDRQVVIECYMKRLRAER